MAYFPFIQNHDHEGVFFCSDKETGLKAFIGIHNTTLGPALGGIRIRNYASEEEALRDVLKLSRAMSYKSSAAGLNLGGGKTVVLLEHPEQKTPELLKALAKRIHTLKGTYVSAGDIGSNSDDLRQIKQITPWVTGLSPEDGGLGETAILTSVGVFEGVRAAVKERLGTDDLSGLKVAVQGTGKVGYMLIEHLIEAGCEIWATDINEGALDMLSGNYPQVHIVKPDEIYNVEVDVFSPNAIGGIVTTARARTLNTKIIAGGANNILTEAAAADELRHRNILYAPDFLINAGGVIMADCEIKGKTYEQAEELVKTIYDRTLDVFHVAKEEDVSSHEAAKRIAIRRIEAAAKDKEASLAT